MKIGVSKVKAFTGAGWTTNLTIGGIYQFMGGWVVNCGTVDSMENGKVYLTQIEISVVKS